MAEIQPPADYCAEVKTVAEYLKAVTEWHKKYNIVEKSFLSKVWLRGNGEPYKAPLSPSVYREDFTDRALSVGYGANEEEKRLNLEREMLNEFRTSGAVFLNTNNIADVYFIAQHYGMPTRLLDWTTNPLAALFFAVENKAQHKDDGELFIMEAKGILPPVPGGAKGDECLWNVVSMRHPYVTDAIGQSFWHEQKKERFPLIVPVRPDNQPGRIGQQSSCFTVHMHGSAPQTNKTLAKMRIPASAKVDLLNDLHRLNINQFTTYNDLDHLSKDIRRAWGFK